MNHILVKESCSAMRGQARELLQGRWKNAMWISLIYYLAIGGVETVIALLFGNPSAYGPDAGTGLIAVYTLLVAGPLTYGYIKCFCRIAEGEQMSIGDLFTGFEDFGRLFLVNLIIMIFVTLWSLLLIVPGIIAALAYSMTFFLIVSNGSLRPMEAIRLSKQKMKGNKGKFFLLCLSFIGWILVWIIALAVAGAIWGVGLYERLSVLTDVSISNMYLFKQAWIAEQFIGLFFSLLLYVFLMPYIMMSQFVFYRHLTGWEKLSDDGAEAAPEPDQESKPERKTEDERIE